jgi:hypothetical protein
MAGLVRRLLGVLGNIPMLGPDRLDFLLEQLVTRLPVADPSAQDIRTGISDAARAEGLDIAPGAVNAVMHRAGLAGFDWQATPGAATSQQLRQALLDNIRQQMQQQRMDLPAEDAALLAEWVGQPPARELAPAPEAAFGPPEELPDRLPEDLPEQPPATAADPGPGLLAATEPGPPPYGTTLPTPWPIPASGAEQG